MYLYVIYLHCRFKWSLKGLRQLRIDYTAIRLRIVGGKLSNQLSYLTFIISLNSR